MCSPAPWNLAAHALHESSCLARRCFGEPARHSLLGTQETAARDCCWAPWYFTTHTAKQLISKYKLHSSKKQAAHLQLRQCDAVCRHSIEQLHLWRACAEVGLRLTGQHKARVADVLQAAAARDKAYVADASSGGVRPSTVVRNAR